MNRWIPIALLLAASACTDGRMTPPPTDLGAPCLSDGDCDTGLCLLELTGGVCTRDCADDCACPAGYSCQAAAGGRSVCAAGANACVSAPDAGPPGGCGAGCPAGQACVSGACTTLPSSCPCPTGSYCDLATDRCLPGCRSDDHCAAGSICDGTECRGGCRDDAQCPTGQICDADTSACRAGCREDADCSGAASICDEASSSCRMGCRAEDDCPEGFECDFETSTCEGQCTGDADCWEGTVCEGELCVRGCRSGTLCESGCADTLTDVFNCGGCGNRCDDTEGTPVCRDGFCDFECAPGETRCGDRCVDLQYDSENCGACGTTCDDPYRGRGFCSAGTCDFRCDSDARECGSGCCGYGDYCCPSGDTAYCLTTRCF